MMLPRPLEAPPWFTFFADGLQSFLSRFDRETIKSLRFDFDTSHAGSTISLGALPPNAVILYMGAAVHEAFNAGTSNLLDIGTVAVANFYASNLSLTTLGFKSFNQTVSLRPSQTQSTEIKFTVNLTGTAATTGKASVLVLYFGG